MTAAAKEKALDEPVPEPVVVISSTEEENGKVAVRRGLKEAVDRALANKRTVTEVTAATREKALDKPVPESVVVISSTEEENNKVAVRRVLKEGSSKKKSLTSVLTARSKVKFENCYHTITVPSLCMFCYCYSFAYCSFDKAILVHI